MGKNDCDHRSALKGRGKKVPGTQMYKLGFLKRAPQEIIAWLTQNDPNGLWIDENSEAEGWQPITPEAAESAMRKALSEANNDQ